MFQIRRATVTLRRYAVADRPRWVSSGAPTKDKFKIVVLGGGTSFHDDHLFRPLQSRIWTGSGGLSVSQQLYNRFDAAGKRLKAGDIAILDAAEYHNYQVCVCPFALTPSMRSCFCLYSLDGTSD
jgi:hypothetical protein